MRPDLTHRAQDEMEQGFALKRESMRLLGLVVAEWRSDPMSVQCFDLRLVERARQVVAQYERLSDLAK